MFANPMTHFREHGCLRFEDRLESGGMVCYKKGGTPMPPLAALSVRKRGGA
jgi:hypothetical protein